MTASLRRLAGITAVAAGLALTPADRAMAEGDTIVDVAVEAGSFGTLVAALQAGDLVETLMGEGPFTVFAPTDEAFAALPEGTVESLLLPENKDQLVSILTYHVVPASVLAAEVIGLTSAPTVNGQNVSITIMDGTVMVDNAKVTATDIMASNGIIHVIDAVIIPSAATAVESSSWGAAKRAVQ